MTSLAETPGRILPSTAAAHAAIARWLFVMAGLVFLMVVVGGATRLTESGLSMVDWEPLRGIIPPLNAAEWAEEFAAYQRYPEYQLNNKGMTLGAFKAIYWWEYGHRVLGRLLGLAFALPLIWFWVAGYLRTPVLKLKLIGLFLLGGSQGLLGWYMVQSGLVSEPEVSQYRLAAHLMLAVTIFSALLWTAMDLMRPEPARETSSLRAASIGICVLLLLQIFMGALVAGLDAGRAYNSWPLMDGALVPDGLAAMKPIWLNWFESTLAVQFNHRIGAYALFAAVVGLWIVGRKKTPGLRGPLNLLFALVIWQLGLGILTLLWEVPVLLGTLHQASALLILAAMLWLLHDQRQRRPRF